MLSDIGQGRTEARIWDRAGAREQGPWRGCDQWPGESMSWGCSAVGPHMLLTVHQKDPNILQKEKMFFASDRRMPVLHILNDEELKHVLTHL